MGRYPYTIDNGSGELLSFTGVTRAPDGERIEVEGVAQPGAGPPMHVHYIQDEAAQVVTGRLGYQILGEEPKFANAGDTVVWPAGTPHKWWNAGTTELRMTGWCRPPDNIEFYLGEIFASMKRNGGRPALLDAAFLMTRYHTEFDMLVMPSLARKIVIPIFYWIGRVIGAHRKYDGAPKPVIRSVAPASR